MWQTGSATGSLVSGRARLFMKRIVIFSWCNTVWGEGNARAGLWEGWRGIRPCVCSTVSATRSSANRYQPPQSSWQSKTTSPYFWYLPMAPLNSCAARVWNWKGNSCWRYYSSQWKEREWLYAPSISCLCQQKGCAGALRLKGTSSWYCSWYCRSTHLRLKGNPARQNFVR